MNRSVKICLNAMVANEANTITRMLNSCYKHIDYWVIQDNGSTDGTQDIIKAFFAEKNIPGFLYETEWQYPGYNRDHTLQTCLKADHNCDWILRMDADEQLAVDDTFDWSILEDKSIDSFNVPAFSSGTVYFRTWLWNSNRPWFFAHDKRHETIHLPDVGENFRRVNLPNSFRHVITNDGQTWYKPMKFLVDALELELDKVPTNKVLEDVYHLWYIGKSYADCYWEVDTFPFKKAHANEYARRSIFYFEQYLERVHNYSTQPTAKHYDEWGYYGLMLIGLAYKFLGDTNLAITKLFEAEQFSPSRNEHLLHLAEIYEELGDFDSMLKVTEYMTQPDRLNPFPGCAFLIENRAYIDTSYVPFWMYLRAVRGVGEDTYGIKMGMLLRYQLPEDVLNDIH